MPAISDIIKSTRVCPIAGKYCIPSCAMAHVNIDKWFIDDRDYSVKWRCGLDKRFAAPWIYPEY